MLRRVVAGNAGGASRGKSRLRLAQAWVSPFVVVAVVLGVLMTALWRTPGWTAQAGAVAGAEEVDGRFDYAGLIHVHSEYSDDASGSYASLARTAAAQGIRFLVATDHNTLEPVTAGEEGWRDGVLMLAGMESSRPEGYLLAMNVATAPADSEQSTEAFLSAMSEQDGMTLLAHAAHRKWGWRGPIDDRVGGMEILDLADQFHAAPLATKLTALALLPFNRMGAYLELGTDNAPTLRIWDRMTQRRRFVGVYAPDLHQSIELWHGRSLAFPPAAEIMRIGRNHIVSRVPLSGDLEADRALVYRAISNGRLYVSLDVLGDATGFMFAAKQGASEAWMGDEIVAGPRTVYSVTLPNVAGSLGAVIRVLRNGVEVARSRAGALSFAYEDGRPGVYRTETVVMVPTAFGPDRETIWIYSNPIYSRSPTTEAPG